MKSVPSSSEVTLSGKMPVPENVTESAACSRVQKSGMTKVDARCLRVIHGR
jgi:hypothetical protein